MEKRDGVKIKYCTVNKDKEHQSYNDKPAVVYSSGRKEWHHNGQLHRRHGPAIKDPVGQTTEWLIKGDMHREEGPAYIFKGELFYFLDGYEFDDVEEWAREVKKRKDKKKLKDKQDKTMKKWILIILVGGIIVGVLANVTM